MSAHELSKILIVDDLPENLQALDVLPRIDDAVMARVDAALAG